MHIFWWNAVVLLSFKLVQVLLDSLTPKPREGFLIALQHKGDGLGFAYFYCLQKAGAVVK